MSEDFSIHSFITEVRNENPTMAPEALTKQVLIELPEEHEREALEQALRIVVSNSVTKAARPFLHPVPSPAQGQAPASHEQPSRDSVRSWKTSSSRRRWEAYLESPFHVVPGSRRWIAFGDCTLEDLTQGAESRHELAASIASTAAGLEEWTALLTKHKARRVRDLPQSVLRVRLDRGVAA